MLKFIAFITSCLCTIYFSNTELRKSPTAKTFLDSTKLPFTTLLKWRANSSLQTDIKKASRFFGYITAIGVILTLLCNFLNITLNFYVALVILLSLFTWIALEWGTDPYKETLRIFKPLVFAVAAPFFLYFLNIWNPSQSFENYIGYTAHIFHLTNFSMYSNYDLIVTICLTISIIVALAFVGFWIVLQNSIIVLLFLFVSWITARLSRFVLGLKKNFVILVIILYIISLAIMSFG